MAAGCATLSLLKSFGDNYQILERRTKLLCSAMEQLFNLKGIPVRINRAGSMFTVFFTGEEVRDYASASRSDTSLYARYFKEMLTHGVLMAPSQFEAAFLSFAHTDEDMEQTFDACEAAIRVL
jgi:glutamate-1-semialdehyde 2,1-aminomutase